MKQNLNNKIKENIIQELNKSLYRNLNMDLYDADHFLDITMDISTN